MPPRRSPRRPRLFLLVYGATLLLAFVTCLGLALVSTSHVVSVGTAATVAADSRTVRELAQQLLLDGGPAGRPILAADADEILSEAAGQAGLLGLRLRTPAGEPLVGTGVSAAPADAHDAGLALARSGSADARITRVPGVGDAILVEYLPVVRGGDLVAIAEILRDARPILVAADASRRDVTLVALAATAMLAAVLYLLFSATRQRLERQTGELIEAQRRDPLTGFLNHGAIVSSLAQHLEKARTRGDPVGVGLLDVDNFRLFNSTHGEASGDIVLATVADVLMTCPEPPIVGRYGPDEFLLIAPGERARRLESTIGQVRERLDETTIRLGRSQRLPVSVSAGIAHFPFHASSAAELLAAATVALGEAKGSGGDAIRTSGAWTESSIPGRTSFDILQGLVIAVDTKDRYTKRHSEDVSRYAFFLAEQLDLDERLRATIQTAGLLHDVGKIGIPDDILRKPGTLTPHEYEIVQQHVALGDLIAHGVPNSVVVRAGIRHHHERWDGAGYLDGLAGERIPLIARILAVADAFSAMTTTRPYRKALSVEAALQEVRDVAGTQLDPTLAMTFADAMESVPSAPMPGDGRPQLLSERVA